MCRSEGSHEERMSSTDEVEVAFVMLEASVGGMDLVLRGDRDSRGLAIRCCPLGLGVLATLPPLCGGVWG